MKSKLGIVGIIGVAVFLFFLTGYAGYKSKQDATQGKANYDVQKPYSDLIGTSYSSSPTSTPVGVCFACENGGMSVTTSYVAKIGATKSIAVIQLKAVGVSTTPFAQFDVQGSNDYYCETTATSTTDTSLGGDAPLISEINWSSIDNLRNVVHTRFSSGSSTSFVAWSNPMVNAIKTLELTDLSYSCLRLNVRASSTMLWGTIVIR